MVSASARLLRLLTALQRRKYWTGPDLAEHLEVTARTLRRDIDRLRSLGYTVDASTGPGGGYQLGHGSVLPPLLLGDDEAVAIAVALRSAADLFDGVAETAIGVLLKLQQVLPLRLRRRVTALQSATLSVGHGRTHIVDAHTLALLAGACRDQERITFDYQSHGGAQSMRRAEPLKLAHTGNRRWYLIAYDNDRCAWRTFRVDRIGVVRVGIRYEPHTPPDDLEQFISTAISSASYTHQARLRLSGSATAMATRIPSWIGTIESIDDRSCRLHIGADSYEGLISHILLAQVDFELESPSSLRPHLQRVADRISRASKDLSS